jgi:hypothetical protein
VITSTFENVIEINSDPTKKIDAQVGDKTGADLLAFPPRARARGAKTPSGANLTSSPGERPDSLNKNSSPERNQGATFTLAKNRTERSGLQMPM